MPFQKLALHPGVNVEQSQTLNQTQFAASQNIRFYNGLPQKLGGWQAITTDTVIGTARAMHGWADIVGNTYLATGSDQRLQVFIGGIAYDITPLAQTDNPAVSFSTTVSTTDVLITDAGYSPSAGDWINLQTQISVGGVVLFGYYIVTATISSTQFQIQAASNATSTVVAGGAGGLYTTSNGFAPVSIALNNHGLAVNDLFNVEVAVTVGGLTISGIYNVTSVTDANHFFITAASVATSTATVAQNTGLARIQYLLPSGYAVNTALAGWGVGDYGAGDYGLANSATSVAYLRQWSLDHWGQDLIACPSNGKIYYWQPPTIAPAAVISGSAPIYNTLAFVMPQAQIIVACGSETGGTQEPTLVRWSDVGDFTTWTASSTNQAGSFFLPTGSTIIAALPASMSALIWTDVDLWSMNYQGLPFVFGFNRIAAAVGPMAQRSVATVGADVWWPSVRGFYHYAPSGGVTAIECPVLDFVLFNIDTTQLNQVFSAVNGLYNEIAWHFPLDTTSPYYEAGAMEFAWVKYNFVESVWDFSASSQYQRTAWIPSSVVGNPMGVDLTGVIQQHEVGTNANGAGMEWSWTTGYFDIAAGEQYVFVDLMIPDFVFMGTPTIQFTLYVTNYPGDTPVSYGPYAISPTSQFIPLRLRGRQIAIEASGNDLNSFNRLGAIRIRIAPDGRN